LVQKIVEQGAVTDHGLAEVLSTSLTLTFSQGDLKSDTVVFYDQRMIYREIRGILVESRLPDSRGVALHPGRGSRHDPRRPEDRLQIEIAPGVDPRYTWNGPQP